MAKKLVSNTSGADILQGKVLSVCRLAGFPLAGCLLKEGFVSDLFWRAQRAQRANGLNLI
jgi:hypothetical protein